MKKLVSLSLASGLLILLAWNYNWGRLRSTERPCPFCSNQVLDTQVFYRKNGVLGVVTHQPAVKGHVLIVPERHVTRFEELTTSEMASIQEAIIAINGAVKSTFGHVDYLLIQKNGKGAYQSVPHVHFHYMPGAKYVIARYFFAAISKPKSFEEIKSVKEALFESLSKHASTPSSPL